MRKKQYRNLATALVLSLTVGMFPTFTWAANTSPDSGGEYEYCLSHEDGYGYTESTPERACDHKHTEPCYHEVTRCVHKHTENCYPTEYVPEDMSTPSESDKTEPICGHICSEESGCITLVLDCRHVHDKDCGYFSGESKTATPSDSKQSSLKDVQKLIDSLPTAEELADMSQEAQKKVYENLQAAYDAYEALTEQQQEMITGSEIFDQLFAVFNGMINTVGTEVASLEELQSQIDDASGPTEITITGSFEITETISIPAGKNITLISDGSHTLSRGMSYEQQLFAVEGTLTLGTAGGMNGALTIDGSGSAQAPLVGISSTGTVTLYDGVVLQNNYNTSSISEGGAVMCEGQLFINGGAITGNSADSGGGVFISGATAMVIIKKGDISENTAFWGGGIYNSLGTLQMEGGNILNNSVLCETPGSTSHGQGGGVMNCSQFIMEGGVISGNQAYNGGGVYSFRTDATFIMKNGTISSNTAIEGETLNADYFGGNGSGIYLNNGAEMTIENGAVTGNRSEYDGGGIYSYSGSSLSLKGGTISQNISVSSKTGGAIYIRGTLSLQGNISIPYGGEEGSNDLYLYDNQPITVSGSLTGNETIPLALDTYATMLGQQILQGGPSVLTSSAGRFMLVNAADYEIGTDGRLKVIGDGILELFVNGSLTGTFANFPDALAAIPEYSTGTIVVKKGYKLPAPITIPENKKVILLPPSGETVSLKRGEHNKGALFNVDWGGTLILGQKNETGTLILDGLALPATGAIVLINNGGTFELQDGGVIQGGTSGGVSNSGIFKMDGGRITGNIFSDEKHAGVVAGGILHMGQSMTITGGEISHNSSEKGAGGIYVRSRINGKPDNKVVISGGRIFGNTGGLGGGIYINMTQGSPESCTIENNVEIFDNHATTAGGGIYSCNGETIIKGGIIHGNRCDAGISNGIGVTVRNAPFRMTDNAKVDINNDVLLYQKTSIDVKGLSSGDSPAARLIIASQFKKGDIVLTHASEKLMKRFQVSNTTLEMSGTNAVVASEIRIPDELLPAAPIITATETVDTVTIHWSKPESNGSAITGYRLTVKQNGTEIPGSPFTIKADATSYQVTGLSGGVTYEFVLTAVNALGETSSDSVLATPTLKRPTGSSSSTSSQTPNKGQTDPNLGIITGSGPDQSQWIHDEIGWWLRYPDGSYPKGTRYLTGSGSLVYYQWEKIDGAWYAFDENGYAATGWIYDGFYNGWFYLDINCRMLDGWQNLGGRFYHLNPVSDGTCGIMRTGWQEINGKWYYFYGDGSLAVSTVVDGHLVGADGARLD